MRPFQFYLINSKKSEEVVNGIKKITLGCENHADAFGFLWIDAENKILQIQLIFGEIVLEWFIGKGIKCSRTNRDMEVPEGIGYQKGVRVLLPVEDTETIESVLLEVRNAEFPPEWSEKILEKF